MNDHLLKFPQTLPNDIEDFIHFYPNKFPAIIKEYETLARKCFQDPIGFMKMGDRHYQDVVKGFKKLAAEREAWYQAHPKASDLDELTFLVEFDGRLNKLFAFRFWIVNYLFADGPIHEYYVDRLKQYARRLIEVEGVEIHDYESRAIALQRDLMQGEYADLYLQDALNCEATIALLRQDKKTGKLLDEIGILISKKDAKDKELSKKKLDLIINLARHGQSAMAKKIKDHLHHAFAQAEWRETDLPLYNTLTQAIEFEEENIRLRQRQDELHEKIRQILIRAKKIFKTAEFKEFVLCYQMAGCFAKYKDVMGQADDVLIPMWNKNIFGRMFDIVLKMNPDCYRRGLGPGGMFYFFVWFLPDELKAKVMTPDKKSFSLKSL